MVSWARLTWWSATAAWARIQSRYLCRHRRLRHWRGSTGDHVFCLACGRIWKRKPTNPNILEAEKR